MQQVVLPLLRTAEEVTTPSQPAIKEEEEIVDISESGDDFEIFSHHQLSEAPVEDFSHLSSTQVSHTPEAPHIPDAMVLQRRSRTSLQELMESQARGNAPEKAVQPKISALPPT